MFGHFKQTRLKTNVCSCRCEQGMSWVYGSQETRRIKFKSSPANEWSQQIGGRGQQNHPVSTAQDSNSQQIKRNTWNTGATGGHGSLSNITPGTQSDCSFPLSIFIIICKHKLQVCCQLANSLNFATLSIIKKLNQ